jgi:hypothetical protein
MRHASRVHVPFVAGLFVAVMLYGVPAGAANDFEPATPRGKVAACPRGTFPDISRKIGRVECWKCPKGSEGQFWDRNGTCYSCPDGFERTVFPITPITSPQACSRPAYVSAARSPDAGCPEGTFLDIGRGDCWSCPDRWYRTVNPVDSKKACTSTVANIFAVDSTAMCTQFLKALREGASVDRVDAGTSS